MELTCPWCAATRGAGATCPRCGADYAKAEQIRRDGRASVAEAPVLAIATAAAPPEDIDEEAVADPRLEWRLRAAALPGALAAAVLMMHGARFVQRTFFTMPVHELGHAVTAWFCGHAAIPTLWFTWIDESRGWFAGLLLAAALAAATYRAHTAHKPGLVAVGVALLIVQALCTLWIGERTALMLVTFGGDGMGMVLATVLMAGFFFGTRTQWYRGGLRWGFLAIGAAAFVDIFATWWSARNDYSDVPLGEMEGRGPSDASKLVDWYGWPLDALVGRYVKVGVCCLLVLAAVYAWGVWRAWRLREDRRV